MCLLGRVDPARLDEYRERHADVWPEMRAALSRHGWTNYSLFLTDDGLLIGYLETEDYAAALAGMAGEEVNARWQAQMGPYFVGLEGRRPDEGFLVVPEVFHLD